MTNTIYNIARYVHVCIYVYVTLEQEYDISNLKWNIHLELPTGIPAQWLHFGIHMD